MHRFYVDNEAIHGESIYITGSDVNHIKNVLRMKPEDSLIISNGQGKEFNCIIKDISESKVLADIVSCEESLTELDTKIYLYQGLPKKDKMELIIQKAVELGVYEIIPVMMKRTIVKLEDKKKELKKLERWQQIAVSAAKQSNRGIIPKVHEVVSYKEALKLADNMDLVLLPYENAKGIDETKRVIAQCREKKSIGIFIGPEGGFDQSEIEEAIARDVNLITLGRRILRTETAGLTILSILMFELEEDK